MQAHFPRETEHANLTEVGVRLTRLRRRPVRASPGKSVSCLASTLSSRGLSGRVPRVQPPGAPPCSPRTPIRRPSAGPSLALSSRQTERSFRQSTVRQTLNHPAGLREGPRQGCGGYRVTPQDTPAPCPFDTPALATPSQPKPQAASPSCGHLRLLIDAAGAASDQPAHSRFQT